MREWLVVCNFYLVSMAAVLNATSKKSNINANVISLSNSVWKKT
jgi:hypothetical protein